KLAEARRAAETDKMMQRNVAALEKVQPTPLKITEIDIKLGASWVPPDVISAWLDHLFEREGNQARYNTTANKWSVRWAVGVSNTAKNQNVYAGGGMDATKLIQLVLDLKGAKVVREEPDGQ